MNNTNSKLNMVEKKRSSFKNISTIPVDKAKVSKINSIIITKIRYTRNPYMNFQMDFRKRPENKYCSFTEVSTASAKVWKCLSQNEKEHYQLIAKNCRRRRRKY